MKIGILEHPDLQPVDVLELGDLPPVVGQVPEAIVPVAKPDQALLRQLVEQLLADRAIEDRIDLARILEHERQVEGRELLDLPGEQPRAHHRHLDRAALQGRDRLQVAAERAAGEDPHLDLAAALGSDDLGEALGSQPVRMIGCLDDGQLEGVLLDLGLSGARQQQPGDGETGQETLPDHAHAFPLLARRDLR